MSVTETGRPPRLNSVFDGFPSALLPTEALERLTRFYVDLDALGRIDAETDEPLVDELTLTAMLREFVGWPCADRLVCQLADLPASAFRPAQQVGSPIREASWFELANKVVVFDASVAATFRELELPPMPKGHDVVMGVRARFPSLEEELLTPDLLPPRIEALLEPDSPLDTVLRAIARQLGWWAALVAILLVPPAVVARSYVGADVNAAPVGNAWPLSMYVLAAAIGGWTLTVVGSCLLAPVQ